MIRPASENQKLIAASLRLYPNAANHYFSSVCVDRRPDMAFERRVLSHFVERHAMLRARLVDDGTDVELVLADRFDIDDYIGMEEVPSCEGPAAVDAAAAFVARPIDPRVSPPYRCRFFVAPDGYLLVRMGHHVVFDGHTRTILLRELKAIALNLQAGRAPDLPPLAGEYQDYVAWEDARHRTETGRRNLDSALEQLGGYDLLPIGAARDARHPGMLLSPVMVVDADRSARLRVFAREECASAFNLFVAVYALALGDLTGRSDVGIAAPFGTDRAAGLSSVAGNMIDHLPLRFDLAEAGTFRQLVVTAKRRLLESRRRFVPFNAILRGLGHNVNAAPRPYLQAIVSYLGGEPGIPPNLLGCPTDVYEAPSGQERPFWVPGRALPLELQDIGFLVTDYAGTLRFRLSVRADLIRQDGLDALAVQLGDLFADLADAPDAPLDRVSTRLRRGTLQTKEVLV
jgi:hypothetical protein